MHHQDRECGPQWEMRSSQGTAIPDHPEQRLTWGNTDKHNLRQTVLNEVFISWSKHWNCTTLFQRKRQCIFLIFLLEKWLENAKSRSNMESSDQLCLPGNLGDAQPAWLLPNCCEFSMRLLWQACDPILKWLSILNRVMWLGDKNQTLWATTMWWVLQMCRKEVSRKHEQMRSLCYIHYNKCIMSQSQQKV